MFAHKTLRLAAVAAMALSATTAHATILHKLVTTILDSGNPGQTLPSGYNTMETAAARCPQSSCTVSMQIMADVGNATCTNEWAVVGLVDGRSVDGGPLQSSLPTGGKYQTRTWSGQYTMSQGKHTFAFQLYVPCATNAYQWSVNYTVTTP